MHSLSVALFFLVSIGIANAKVVTVDWSIDWVWTAPTNHKGPTKPLVGINGQWPCPQLDVDKGDTVIVNVCNNLGNQSTTIHWHGIHHNGTNIMDGANGVTQCAIAPGQRQRYEFIADKPGTYWYHSHVQGQFPDGLWGPFIIHDPNPPFKYDEEFTFALTDWYNEPSPELIHRYQSPEGEAYDAVPRPSGGAMYGYWGKYTAIGKNLSIPVEPNKTYLIHLICAASYPGIAWVMSGHNQTTVEVDGVYVNPVNVNKNGLLIRLAPGQRQAVLVNTRADASKNFALWSILDLNILFANKKVDTTLPEVRAYDANVTSWLVYNNTAPKPPAPIFWSLENEDFFDDLDYVPLDGMPLLEPVDHQIYFNTTAQNISSISRFGINNSTYLGASVPSLYTALSVGGQYVGNSQVYGGVNPIVLKHNEVVEIIINNQDNNLHPWHLHGHQFQVLDRPNPFGGNFNGTYSRKVSKIPVRRDTVMLQDKSYAVIRFRADNPGVWLFHCHIELHMSSGLIATFIEAPELIESRQKKPSQEALDLCKSYSLPVKGNADGNFAEPLSIGAPPKISHVNWGAMYPPNSPPYEAKSPKQCKNPSSSRLRRL
jgi:iron transport multicopper oxidase